MQNRGSQTGLHVPLVVHLPIWKGAFKVSKRRKKYIYTLFISNYLYIWICPNHFMLLMELDQGEHCVHTFLLYI